PGMPTSPCPGSPWPGFRAVRPGPKKRGRHRRAGPDQLHTAGDTQAAGQLDPALRTRSRTRLGLVTLAPTTPVPGSAMPLPATRIRIQLSAVAVLAVVRRSSAQEG